MTRFIKKFFKSFKLPVLVLAFTAGCAVKTGPSDTTLARWEANRASYEAEKACNRVLPGETWVEATTRINSDPKLCTVVK